ncbi:MAG: hypothetical protein GC160_11920 [Acidobacteria bacterium]|nr:hypothetical protein [Acidobacteriota bacterium]
MRLPKEVDTEQVGGIAAGRLIMDLQRSQLGVLRCQAGEAFVALKLRHGSAVDFLQIGCAPVECRDGRCSWQRATWAASAGSKGGGFVTVDQSCPADSVITGFNAATNFAGAFAYDLQIECSRMAGRPPISFINGLTVVPVATGSAVYAQRRDETTGRPVALEQPSVRASCRSESATAVSYAMGRYGVQPTPVVQALSFYCADRASSARDEELVSLAAQLRADAARLKAMGETAADHFLFGVSETMVATLEYFAEPHWQDGGVVTQTAQQLFDFLMLPSDQRNQMLAQAASDAWKLFTTDPARFFGQNAQDLIPAGAGTKALEAARAAAKSLLRINKYGQKFGTMGFLLRGSKFNPAGSTTNCFLCSVAYDRTRATKRMWVAPEGPIVDSNTIHGYLRSNYGYRALDPNHGPDGLAAHRLGMPVPSSREQIERSLMGLADPDARGLVFVKSPSEANGHIFNAFKHDGQVYFYDAQGGFYANSASFPFNADVMFYRTN